MTNKTRDDNPGPARAVEVVEVTGGVDTHADAHTAAAVDQIGGLLGTATFPATAAGYRDLASWLAGFGPLARVGVEGTGSYGAGLTRHLTAAAVEVVEVTRPNRADRRNRGKTDTLDAVHAARAALAGTATGTPKTRDGIVESIRVLHVTRRGAVKARTATRNEFAGLLVTAPEPIRAALAPLTATQRVRTAAGYRPGPVADPTHATKTALRALAHRIQHLTTEITNLDNDLAALTRQAAPQLLHEVGIGADTAAQLLITAGDNPDRLRSEASFAAVCGVSPVPASSGRTDRHRLNRGGDRQANRALYTIALTRMRYHDDTKAYIARTTATGKTPKEAIRLLKRYLARRIYRLLTTPAPEPRPIGGRPEPGSRLAGGHPSGLGLDAGEDEHHTDRSGAGRIDDASTLRGKTQATGA
jgi:transposase